MRLAKLTTLASVVTVTAGATTVSLPAFAPAGAVLVDPSFPGTSFELSTFSLYAQSR
jgi:hypothetical protein